MNGTERMRDARSQLVEAEATLALEHTENLHAQFAAAIKEGRDIDEKLIAIGARLVQARAQAEPLWQKRDLVNQSKAALDKAFQAIDFPGPSETEKYERERAQLLNEWDRLTAEIIALSNRIGSLQHEYDGWKVARGRAERGVSDCRLALRGELVGTQRM